MKFKSLGNFSCGDNGDTCIFLEPDCEEIHLRPGETIELLIEDHPDHFPIDYIIHENSIQIYPKHSSPDWLLRYKGKEYEPGWHTIVSELGE